MGEAEFYFFPKTVGVAEGFEEDVGGDVVFAVGAQMVAEDAFVALEAGGGCAAGAHGYKILGNVGCEDAVDIDEAEELLEVGGHLEVCVEETEAGVDRAAAVERGVGRHESHQHFPAAKGG